LRRGEGVLLGTANTAALLVDHGLVEVKRQRGTYVKPADEPG
jgi:DNA-binding GntR family transcriptional regulator